MNTPAIQYLPPVAIEGLTTSDTDGSNHPMREVTRRAAGLQGGGWTGELRGDVERFFENLAGEWHTRTSPDRTAVVMDALVRGLDPMHAHGGLGVEVGSGIGAYSSLITQRFATALAVDLSRAMLERAPGSPSHRVQADGSALPLRDGAAAAVVLINAFLFPAEVARVLSRDGILVWVNIRGEQTPIYLSVDDVLAALPGEWTGVASRAGEGSWCALRRA